MDGTVALVGLLGLFVVEGSYVPQIVRLHRLKRADDVSALFPGMNVLGRLLALAYSLAIGQPVFVVGFLVGALTRSTLLLQVVWYRWGRPAVAARIRPAPAEARS
jgi:lipid-A-disaccharide synthase-like uncharacterized protein